MALHTRVALPVTARLPFAALRPRAVLLHHPARPCIMHSRSSLPSALRPSSAPAVRAGRASALCTRAMVNVDFSPSVLMGVGLIGAGLSLWQVRQSKPYLSKDYDVVVSCVSLLVGGILIFQGWRLDPLLLFGQLMTTGTAVSFAIEALRLRSDLYKQQEEDELRTALERKRGGGGGPDAGAALQLPPPLDQAAGGAEQQQLWGQPGWTPQQQQQQQPWESGYAQDSSGYYDSSYYYQQSPNQQQPEAAAPSGAAYGGQQQQQPYGGAYSGGYYDSGYSSSSTGGFGGAGYGMQAPQQQQEYGGQPVEPDYTVPPGEGPGGYYSSSGAAAPAEYVFPDAQAPPYAADSSGGSSSGSTGGGGGRGGSQTFSGGVAVGRPAPGQGAYDAEDWD